MSKSVAAGLLALVLLATYSNHFQNSFHFDDAHTIVNNAAIQELRNIPRFFADARSFSALPSNQSYRPIISTLLAIDYKVGGLNPFWFHLSIFSLFVTLVMLLASLIAGARDAHNYLITQPYVALLYFKTFFWPSNLSADYDLNPFTSTSDPRFWLGIVFLALLLSISIFAARTARIRVIGFGVLW